jgi:hypothetical protein
MGQRRHAIEHIGDIVLIRPDRPDMEVDIQA